MNQQQPSFSVTSGPVGQPGPSSALQPAGGNGLRSNQQLEQPQPQPAVAPLDITFDPQDVLQLGGKQAAYDASVAAAVVLARVEASAPVGYRCVRRQRRGRGKARTQGAKMLVLFACEAIGRTCSHPFHFTRCQGCR